MPPGHSVPWYTMFLLSQSQQQRGGVWAWLSDGFWENPFSLLHTTILPSRHFLLLPGHVQQQHHHKFADVYASKRWILEWNILLTGMDLFSISCCNLLYNMRCRCVIFDILFLLSVPEGEPVPYRVETLVLFILGPVVVLVVLSVVSVLACRRLHHGRLQRLQEFDTEQGAVDGLISSNVGDSTLAVRLKVILILVTKRGSICHVVFTPVLKVFVLPFLIYKKLSLHF